MLLENLCTDAGSADAASDAMRLMAELYPICRSITGNGVRRTLDLVGRTIPLERHEVPSGTPVLDWEVPLEWNIQDAHVSDPSGRRVIDFREHSLHVVNYSVPVRRRMGLDELRPHLYSLPERPDWIPYRTSYYREHWGFCLRHRDLLALGPGPYEVVIDSQLAPGHLSYAECVIPGQTAGEAVVHTHVCHPSLANDNLTGIAVAAQLAQALAREKPRLTWRFIFGPGTIGSITWLARNEGRLANLRGGLVIGLLGDDGPITYKRSRLGGTATDRIAEKVLGQWPTASRIVDFDPYGYDERQFCSPGFDLPVGRLTRSPHAAYPEYHTSADNLSLVKADKLAESIRVVGQVVAAIDANRVLVNLSPKGEPRLGKRGLYGSVGGHGPSDWEQALLWLLSLGDGRHDLASVAQRSGYPYSLLDQAAQALEQSGLASCEPELSIATSRSTR